MELTDNAQHELFQHVAQLCQEASQSDDRCGIRVRVSKEMRRELKLAAIDRGTTVQDLMLEAIRVVLAAASMPGP
jgi:uncharacterized protein (DUF1778 family)